MTLTLALAATATLVALAFAASTYERWLARRRRHDLAWALSLVFFACGSLALWAGAALGWGSTTFRLFYLFGAVLNVPFLALGTVYLLGGRQRGDQVAVVVALACAFAAGVIAVAPTTGAIDPAVLPRGSEVFGPLPRVLAAVASGAGALVVFSGAVWSAARLLRGRSRPGGVGPAVSPGRLAAGNLMIALGTAVLSASGLLNSVLGEMQAFAVTLTAGIIVLFAGFLVASGAPRTPLAGVGPVGQRDGGGVTRLEGRATG
ncbi:MAG: hypothetical protein ACR2K0_07390 [Acidimicrobiales bacterium]